MRKRILSVVLACLLAFSVAGCGSDGGKNGQGEAQSGQDGTRNTAQGGDESEDTAQGAQGDTDAAGADSAQAVWVEPEKEEPALDWSAVEMAPEEDFQIRDVTIDGVEGMQIMWYKGEDKVIKVPGTFDGKPLISILKNAFIDVTDVYIETEAALEVQDYAFSKCRGLKSVVILAGGESSMGTLVFHECEGLTSVVLSEGFIHFGYGTFNNTPWLENKRQQNPLVIINSVVIDGRMCVGDVVIPDGVIGIAEEAFHNNTELTGVTLPDSVRWIDEFAFSGCTGLKRINLPDDIEAYGLNAYNESEDIVITYQGKEYTHDDLPELRALFK